MSEYGLAGALLIVSVLFLTLYHLFQRQYNWRNSLADAIAYSLVATFGLSTLITWLLNAANDVYVLLFHSRHVVISTVWRFWENMTIYLMVAIFLVLILNSMRQHPSKIIP